MAFELTTEKAARGFRKMEGFISEHPDILNGMINIHFVSCSVEEKTAEFLFDVKDWERNMYGGVHGGMISTVLDSGMGIAAGVFSGKPASTVSLNVQFIQPGMGDKYRILVSFPHIGRHVIHTKSEMRDAESGVSCAFADAVFTVRDSMSLADLWEEDGQGG